MSDTPTLTISRTYAAAPDQVWRCWTDPDLVARWYGPGVETIIHEMDVRPGGLWRHSMGPKEQMGHERIEYVEVVENQKLVFHQSMANEDFDAIENPMMPTWPKTMRSEVTFEAKDGGTLMTLTWSPHNARPDQCAGFEENKAGPEMGWNKGFEIIGEILDELSS